MLAPLPSAAADGLADRILKLTRATKWSEVAAIKIGFNTFHSGHRRELLRFVGGHRRADQALSGMRDGYDRDTSPRG
jgi:hypothetical protein